MKVSTKGRYSLRFLLDLAIQPRQEPVSLKGISERQPISLKYLEQIIPPLAKAGIIRSVRGPKGGYYLNKSPKDITVGMILRITEGSLAPVDCVDPENSFHCPRESECVTIHVWQQMYDAVTNVVDSITLQDLVDEERAKGGEYYI
ncbi:RrF2 family transcriptional regulator [Catenisphaera adipataccumulans]|uniref:Rrf2 family protein n=1 Tax=Catenisphaera adipataccumulans TaxID=700500 RepID=A0A7W8CWF3_9FIRM|nr:Rrf2 family transcriptional regulator [Catenisphaera adipataccumulans]MBB5182850.1 Rrf2 family protein [Catenisphaera adipataccumulans]